MNRQQQQTVMSQQDTTPLKPLRSAHQTQQYQQSSSSSFSSHKSSAEKIYNVQQLAQQQLFPQSSTFQHQRAFSASQKQQQNSAYLPVPVSVSPIKLPRNLSSDSAAKLQLHQQNVIHPLPQIPIQQQSNNNLLSNQIALSKQPYILCNPGTIYSPAGIPVSYQGKSQQTPSVQSQQSFNPIQQTLNSAQRKGNSNDGKAHNQLNNLTQNSLLNQQYKTLNIPFQTAVSVQQQQQQQSSNLDKLTPLSGNNILQTKHQMRQQSEQYINNEGINQKLQQEPISAGSQQKYEAISGNKLNSISIVQKNSDRAQLHSSNNHTHNRNQIIPSHLSRTQNVVVQSYQPQVLPSEQISSSSQHGHQFSFQQQQIGQIFLNPGNSYHVQPLRKNSITGGSVNVVQGSQREQKKEYKKENQEIDRLQGQNSGNMVVIHEQEEQKNEGNNKLQRVIEDMNEYNTIGEDNNAEFKIMKLEADNVQLIRLVEMLEKRIVEMTEASESAATTGRMQQIESQRQEKYKYTNQIYQYEGMLYLFFVELKLFQLRYQQEALKHEQEIQSLKEKEEQLQKQAEECRHELGAAKEENTWLEEQLDVLKQQCVGLQREKDHIGEELQIAKRQQENVFAEKNKSQKSDRKTEGDDGHMGSYLQSMLNEKVKEAEEQRQQIDTLIKDRQELEIVVTDQKEVMIQLEETVQLLQLENKKLLEIIEVQNDISSAQHNNNNNQSHSFHQKELQSQKQLLNAASEQMKMNEREQFNSSDYRIIAEMEAKLQDLADDNQRLGSSAEQFKQQAQYWKESFELLQGQQQQENQNQQQAQEQQLQQQQSQQKQQSQSTQFKVLPQQPSSQQVQQIPQQQQQTQQQLRSQQEFSQQQQQQQQQSQQSSQQQQQNSQQGSYQQKQQNIQPTVVIQPIRNQSIIQLVAPPQSSQLLARNPQQIKLLQNNVTQSQQPILIHPQRQSLSNQIEDQRQPTSSSPPRNQQPYFSNRSPSPWNSNIVIQPQVVINALSRSWYNPAQQIIAPEQHKSAQQGYQITPTKLLPPAYAPPRRFASAEKQMQRHDYV